VKIAVAELTATPRALDLAWEPEWVREGLGDLGSSQAEQRCEATLTGYAVDKTLIFRGTVRCVVRMECARCLRDVEVDIGGPLDLVLEPRPRTHRGEPDEQLPEIGVGWYEGLDVDLGPFVRELLVLGLPLRALCDENCRGLCPRCGTNRNEGACDCPRD
jgi:uncharacterized protein